jgi:anti-anti-sigma regulatory factor
LEQILSGQGPCILDLEDAAFIDSTGVGLIARMQKHLSARQRPLVLVSPSMPVKRALALLRLDEFVTFAPDHSTGQELLAKMKMVWEQTSRRLAVSSEADCWTVELAEVLFLDSSGLAMMMRLNDDAPENSRARAKQTTCVRQSVACRVECDSPGEARG